MDLRSVGGVWPAAATYRITEHQVARARVVSEVVCVNQQGEEVAAATHLMKVVV